MKCKCDCVLKLLRNRYGVTTVVTLGRSDHDDARLMDLEVVPEVEGMEVFEGCVLPSSLPALRLLAILDELEQSRMDTII